MLWLALGVGVAVVALVGLAAWLGGTAELRIDSLAGAAARLRIDLLAFDFDAAGGGEGVMLADGRVAVLREGGGGRRTGLVLVRGDGLVTRALPPARLALLQAVGARGLRLRLDEPAAPLLTVEFPTPAQRDHWQRVLALALARVAAGRAAG